MTQQNLPVSGAKITLACPAMSERETSTDLNGAYSFTGLPGERCTLSAVLPGFDAAIIMAELQPGQQLQVAPLVLSIATVHITVNALSPKEAGIEEVHNQEQQRLIGWVPNFFVTYNWYAPPLTPKQKFTLATKNASDPGNLALVGTVAGVQQAANAFPGYGQGLQGYGKRYGADLANLVVGTYMGGAVLPTLFHQDPRYFYKGTGTRKQRFLYAISRAVITRGDNGRNQPNYAGVLGDLSAGAISNLYYAPSDRQGAKLFLENGMLAIAGDAMNDFFQEFFFNHITTRGKQKPPKSKQETTAGSP